jgi:hypothetical protein
MQAQPKNKSENIYINDRQKYTPKQETVPWIKDIT